MVLTLHALAGAGYLLAWILQLRGFRDRVGGPRGLAMWVAAAAAALHLAGVLAYGLTYGTPPLVGLGPASSTLAVTIALAFLGASALREETRAAGLFVLPCVLLLLGEALVVGIEPAPRETAFRGPWFVFHVGAVFAGYAGLLLASAAGGMYLLQLRALKRKRFGSVFRFFPSLDGLDALNRFGLLVGFPALTLGLMAGWSFTLTYGRGLALEDPEVLFGLVTWGAFLAAILIRARPGWRGQGAARATAGAFAVTFATFLLLRLTTSAPGSFL